MRASPIAFFIFAAAAALADTIQLEGNLNMNGVGFSTLELAAGSKTILAVPYQDCTTKGGTISLAALVATNNLPSTDNINSVDSAARLYVLPAQAAAVRYKTYYHHSSSGWRKYGSTTEDAATVSLAVGDGIWLVMPEKPGTVYLKGEVVTNQAVVVTQGYNLIGAASPDGYTLDSLAFPSPHAGTYASDSDKLLIPSGNSYAVYYYRADGWHLHVSEPAIALSAISMPAGHGFWYYRYPAESMAVTKR